MFAQTSFGIAAVKPLVAVSATSCCHELDCNSQRRPLNAKADGRWRIQKEEEVEEECSAYKLVVQTEKKAARGVYSAARPVLMLYLCSVVIENDKLEPARSSLNGWMSHEINSEKKLERERALLLSSFTSTDELASFGGST